MTSEQLNVLAAQDTAEPESTSTEQGAEFAARMLSKYEEELSTTGINRNSTLNKIAFHLGTMVARDWITRAEVEEALWRACEANGLAGEEQQKSRDTLARALDEGATSPHPDLVSSSISLEDFRAYMPMHNYVFIPTREIWPSPYPPAELDDQTTTGRSRRRHRQRPHPHCKRVDDSHMTRSNALLQPPEFLATVWVHEHRCPTCEAAS